VVTVVADESVPVTFTNDQVLPDPEVTVTKTWTGVFDDLPEEIQAELRTLLVFNANFEFELGVAKTVNAGDELWIEEIAPETAWEYETEDETHKIVYRVTWDSNKLEHTFAADEKYTFEFTNNVYVDRTPKVVDTTVTVTKTWTGAFDDLPEEVQAELLDRLAITGNFDFTLGVAQTVNVGDEFTVTETVFDWHYTGEDDDNFYHYTIEFDSELTKNHVMTAENYVFEFINNIKVYTQSKRGMAEVSWDNGIPGINAITITVNGESVALKYAAESLNKNKDDLVGIMTGLIDMVENSIPPAPGSTNLYMVAAGFEIKPSETDTHEFEVYIVSYADNHCWIVYKTIIYAPNPGGNRDLPFDLVKIDVEDLEARLLLF
jgi:hypothetical protein